MKYLTLAAALLVPTTLLAAGSVTPTPPTPTETTTECTDGFVYDVETEMCVEPTEAQDSNLLNDQELMEAVREFAYAGNFGAARDILPLLDQADDMVQTYWGFTARKLGDMDAAMVHYQDALATNPDNLLARSYMGQGFVEMGDINAATLQLAEIRQRGGSDTWAATSLSKAIQDGRTYSY